MNWPKLTGNWHLVRQISSGEAATGFVSITAANDGSLLHHEQLVTKLVDGRMINGERRYILRVVENSLEIHFDDGPNKGALFQKFDISNGHSTSIHKCGNDTYASTFEWQPDDKFILTHKVTGPNKDYTIHTVYTALTLT